MLGFRRVRRIDEPAGALQQPRIILREQDSGIVLVVQQPHTARPGRFDPTRVGLDHLSITVRDRDTLTAWAARLDQSGIERSPLREIGMATFLTFEDPDGIQVELWCPSYARMEAVNQTTRRTDASAQRISKELNRLESQRIEAINNSDLDALHLLLAHDYQHCHANGLVQNRDQILANLTANPRTIEARTPYVLPHPTRGVLTGEMRNTRLQPNGETVTTSLWATQVAELRGTHWQFVWFQATKIG